MGRNKIKIEKIKNERIRQVTFYKRKRGLLKKAMELSLLCEVKLFLCIVDKNDKMMIFSSETNLDKFKDNYLDHHKDAREVFSHSDYKKIFLENDIEKSEDSEIEKIIETESEIEENVKNVRKSKLRSKFYKDKPKRESSVMSSYKDVSEDFSGISKLKQRLSLKVMIPEIKINSDKTRSIDSAPKNLEGNLSFANSIEINENNSSINNNINDGNINNSNIPFKPKLGLKINTKKEEDSQNKNTFLNPIPSASKMGFNNFFGNNNDPLFSAQKRYRDDYISFSPNFSAGNFKGFTPIYPNNMSPNMPHIFMFNNSINNSLTPTPKIGKNIDDPSFEYTLNNKNESSINDDNSLRDSSNNLNNNLNHPNYPMNNSNNNFNNFSNVNNVNIEMPKIILVHSSGATMNNPNLGFYSWVMQGSPHPGFQQNNQNLQLNTNPNSAIKKKNIIIQNKIFKEFDEES